MEGETFYMVRHKFRLNLRFIKDFLIKFEYKDLLVFLQKDRIFFQKILAVSMVAGISMNYSTSDRLPLFFLFLFGFMIVLCVSFYSVRMLLCKMIEFEQEAAGDGSLVNAKAKYLLKHKANFNYILTFLIPTIVLLIINHLITIKLGLFVKLFCYSWLYIIVALCVVAYAQYVHFIKLLITISKIQSEIKEYNHLKPHESKWIVILAKTANKESNLFFIVGLIFIVLFYIISFSGLYGVITTISFNAIILGSLWSGAVLGIGVMFPILTIISSKSISKIVEKVNMQKETDLYTKWETVQRQDPVLASTYEILFYTFLNFPKQSPKPLMNCLFAMIVSLINFGASLQACCSMLVLIKFPSI